MIKENKELEQKVEETKIENNKIIEHTKDVILENININAKVTKIKEDKKKIETSLIEEKAKNNKNEEDKFFFANKILAYEEEIKKLKQQIKEHECEKC